MQNNKKLQQIWATENQGAPIHGLDWSPDGKYIAIGTDNGFLKIFDAMTSEYLWGLNLGGKVRANEWSPDGKYIAASNYNRKEIYVVDAETHSIAWKRKLDLNICGIAWSPDGNYIAVGSTNHLYLFKKKGQQIWKSEEQSNAEIWHIAWSHDGDKIAFNGGRNGNSVIVYSRNGTKSWEYKTRKYVVSIDWSPDDKFLAVGSLNNNVYVFDKNGVLVWIKKMNDAVFNVAWDLSGENLAVSGNFGTALFTKNGEQKWIKEYIRSSWSVYAHGNLEWNKYGLLAVGRTKLYILDNNGNLLGESIGLGERSRRISWNPVNPSMIASVGKFRRLYVYRLLSDIGFVEEFVNKCVRVVFPTGDVSRVFEIVVSIRNTTDKIVDGLIVDLGPSSGYLEAFGSHGLVLEFPPIRPGMIIEKRITVHALRGEQLILPYRICLNSVCVDKKAIVNIGRFAENVEGMVEDRTVSMIVSLNMGLGDLERLLGLGLESLTEQFSCRGKWFTARLLRGIVPRKYVGVWECCKLGCGGWGCSYLCRRSESKIVLKAPQGFEAIVEGGVPLTAHKRLLEKIRERASAIAALSHPNILRLLGYGEEAPVLLYEYAEYGALDWQLSMNWMPSNRDLLLMFLQVADALRYIHGRGLVHGDVKPSNIFFVNRVAKIGDFSGLRKLLSMTSSRPGLSDAYTIGFRAPEQVYRDLRVRARKLGLEHMIDIYSLGNTILYVLTGTSIDGKEATDPEVIRETVEMVEDEEIRELLRKMLDPEPWNRPSSIEVVKTILSILSEKGII